MFLMDVLADLIIIKIGNKVEYEVYMKRIRARARGRAARILKPFSKLTITLKQVEEKK